MKKKQQQTYSIIFKKTIQETAPPQTVTLNSSRQIKLTAIILEAHIASLTGTEKHSDIQSQSLKLNYDIDAKFPERYSVAIFKIHTKKEQHYSTTRNRTTTVQPHTRLHGRRSNRHGITNKHLTHRSRTT